MLSFEAEADFSQAEQEQADCFDPESGELLLGDIIISVDKVREQAANFGHSEKREFAFLVAHSMLHLCGYDHMTEEEAGIMESRQEKVLENLGITRDIR
jgi:probable rRNA maturation factor